MEKPVRLILAEDARRNKFGPKAPSTTTVWRWEKSGEIPHSFKIGALRYFDEDALDAAIRAKRDAAQNAA